MHDKSTLRLDVRISKAEDALSKIVEISNWNKEVNECVNVIQLVLKICEHKMLRLEELEKEVSKLRITASVQVLAEETNLAEHCAKLESEILELKAQLEEVSYNKLAVG